MRLPRLIRFVSVLVCAWLFTPVGLQAQEVFDVVIAGGRIMDPETKLDMVGHVGIKDGKIAAVSAKPLQGKETVQAKGLVVAPGFIDLHSHVQNKAGMRMQAFDGVTTALELESGTFPIAGAYDKAAKEGRPINYGYSTGWSAARKKALGESEKGKNNKLKWKTFVTPEESKKVLALIEEGLKEGGIGVGVLLGYTPEAGNDEYLAVAKLAKKYNTPVFTHIRHGEPFGPKNSLLAHQELIAVALLSGAHMHICHLNSTANKRIPEMLEAVEKARTLGLKVTFEGYPYGAGSTSISAAFLAPENLPNKGIKPSNIVYLKTGKPIADEKELARLRKEDPGGRILAFYFDENVPKDRKLMDMVITHKDAVIASDAVSWQVDGKTILDDVWPLPTGAVSHPRSAGCFCRILGRYVREEKKLTLMDALARCSLGPAKILEEAVPQMKKKGRLQVGADADLIAFDPKTVSDRATYLEPNQTSLGMHFVLVNGEFLIRDAKMIKNAFPGKAVRRLATDG